MSIVTFSFLFFLFFSVLTYYIFPKKIRWLVLLISSVYFFLCCSSVMLLYYLLFGVISSYIGTILIDRNKDKIKNKKFIFILTIIAVIAPLFVFKYFDFIPHAINKFSELFNINLYFDKLNLIAPLGISYYTLSIIGYIVDVYWGTSLPQKNILKHALFSCYYPTLISGPIIRYSHMNEQFFETKKINWDDIYIGFYRIIYGFMKKLVLADALVEIVELIFSNYSTYSGIYILFGVVCYAIQIYLDFSGCMDIVIGASRMYGVVLPENFDSPFFSKNLSEFWRRWHITLGAWGKDYIMYPLLKSNLFQKLGTKSKKKFGKKVGKKIPTILAIFILWLLIGIWHGASFKYVFAAGILPWIYLTVGQIFESVPEKLNKVLHIDTTKFSFRLFQSVRTLLFMCLIWIIVNSVSFFKSFDVLKSLFVFADIEHFNNFPKFNQPVFTLMLLLVIIVEYLNYKKINVFEKFREQNIIFRWLILFSLIIIILLYGRYGPLYNAVDFIYGGF